MTGFRTLAVLVLALAIAKTAEGAPDICAESCWEKCFQVRAAAPGKSSQKQFLLISKQVQEC
jgi:hypothetical protein